MTHFFIVSATDLDVNFDGTIDLKAIRVPNKYGVIFSDQKDFGQSYASLENFNPGTKTNFKIINLTENIEVPFFLFDYPLGPPGKINAGDYIVLAGNKYQVQNVDSDTQITLTSALLAISS